MFGAALYVPFRDHVPRHFALVGAFAAVVPDFDVIAFRFGVDYADALGHRGLTHSLVFAIALGAAIVALSRARAGETRLLTWAYLALAIASHGIFDAFTDGGLGVALFAPFTHERFFFPWRPIEVSPIGFSRFFSERGTDVLMSELVWVGIPALAVALFGLAITRRRESRLTPRNG